MKVAVISFPGTSAEKETAQLFQSLAKRVDTIRSPEKLTDDYDLYVLANGKAYGDAIRPGILASFDQTSQDLKKLAELGKIIIGIGNGFQILTELKLLPGSFIINSSLDYVIKEVSIILNDKFFGQSQPIKLSVGHKYGNFKLNQAELNSLNENESQILMTYQNDINGSVQNIAGLTNKDQTIFGMMALPERHQDTVISSTSGIDLVEVILKKKGLI